MKTLKLLLFLAAGFLPLAAQAEPIKLRGSLDVRQRSLVEDQKMFRLRNAANTIVFEIDDTGVITIGSVTVPSGTFDSVITDFIREKTAGGGMLIFQDAASAEFWRMTSGVATATLQANGDANETIVNGIFGWDYNTATGNVHEFNIGGALGLLVEEQGAPALAVVTIPNWAEIGDIRLGQVDTCGSLTALCNENVSNNAIDFGWTGPTGSANDATLVQGRQDLVFRLMESPTPGQFIWQDAPGSGLNTLAELLDDGTTGRFRVKQIDVDNIRSLTANGPISILTTAVGGNGVHLEANPGAGSSTLHVTSTGQNGNASIDVAEDGDSSNVTLSANGTGGETSSIQIQGPNGDGIIFGTFAGGFLDFQIDAISKFQMRGGLGQAILRANGNVDEEISNETFGWVYETGAGNSHEWVISGVTVFQIEAGRFIVDLAVEYAVDQIIIPDSGGAGAATFTLTGAMLVVTSLNIECEDADGCTLSIENAGNGQQLILTIDVLSVGAVTIPDDATPGQTVRVPGASLVLDDYDTATFIQQDAQGNDDWILLATAAND